MSDRELGRIKLGPMTDLIVKETLWQGKMLLQIRKYVTSPRFTGWTKDGIAIPIELKEELQRILQM